MGHAAAGNLLHQLRIPHGLVSCPSQSLSTCRLDLSQLEPTQGPCATGRAAMQPSQTPTSCLAASCQNSFPTYLAQTVLSHLAVHSVVQKLSACCAIISRPGAKLIEVFCLHLTHESVLAQRMSLWTSRLLRRLLLSWQSKSMQASPVSQKSLSMRLVLWLQTVTVVELAAFV